jgi:hypothetical protein
MFVTTELEQPVPVSCDGKPIQSNSGYVAPGLADVNDDGRIDLLVGEFCFSGKDKFPGHKFDLTGKDQQLSGASGYLRLYINQGNVGGISLSGGQRIPTPTGYVKCPTF